MSACQKGILLMFVVAMHMSYTRVSVFTLGVQFQGAIPERRLSRCPQNAQRADTRHRLPGNETLISDTQRAARRHADVDTWTRACSHGALFCTIMDVYKDWFPTKERIPDQTKPSLWLKRMVQSHGKSPCLGQWARLAAVIYEGPWNVWKVVTYKIKGMLHGALRPPKCHCYFAGNVGEM